MLTPAAFRETWWVEFFSATLQQPWSKGKAVPRLMSLLLSTDNGYEAQQANVIEKKRLLAIYREQLWVLNLLLRILYRGAKPVGFIKEDIPSMRNYFNEVRELFGIERVFYTNKIKVDMSESNEEEPGNNNPDSSSMTHRNTDNAKSLQDSVSKQNGTQSERYNENDPEELFFNSEFSHIEKIYIQNSGLVLLWPFLPRLFSNLGFTADDKFVSDEAAVKACLLMQYIVRGDDVDSFEAAMPLNKLLSRIDIFTPINVQLTLTDADRAAADEMLKAVIGHVPVWKDMSIDNLRRAYLQREGMLSTRDAQWLLQVKRETYDILLEKLPWAINMVKFVWMESLIFVEWIST